MFRERVSSNATVGPSMLPERQKLHLTIWNMGGFVEHYHHFLLGFLVPLIRYRERTWQNPAYGQVLIRSCGPMDGLVRQLGAESITIMDRAEHRRASAKRPLFCKLLHGVPLGSGMLRHMELRGHDFPARYNFAVFEDARIVLHQMFRNEIRACAESFHGRFRPSHPRILLLQRGEPDPFYLSRQAEAKEVAGSVRRSISNHAALLDSLVRRFGGAANVTLEGRSLAEQIALFSSADVIIAQHGAALSNLIWAKPNTIVIEIVPKTLSRETLDVGFFSNLSRCMGLKHVVVSQEHAHGDVGVEDICDLVQGALFDRAAAAPVANRDVRSTMAS